MMLQNQIEIKIKNNEIQIINEKYDSIEHIFKEHGEWYLYITDTKMKPTGATRLNGTPYYNRIKISNFENFIAVCLTETYNKHGIKLENITYDGCR